MIEKATELGVSALFPVRTARTIVERLNAERFGAIAIEAAEQSERLTLPVIHPLQPLDRVMAAASNRPGREPAASSPATPGAK